MARDAWRLALGTLSAVPVRPPDSVDRRRAGLAMVIAPLAAVPLGAAVAILAWGGHRLHLSPLLIALLGVGAVAAADRALHLDGLADTADGLAVSYEPERSLAVMKTGSSGPAGVTAIVLVVGVQATGLGSLLAHSPSVRGAVLAGLVVCLSRAALAICCARGVPSARPAGLGGSFSGTVARPMAALVWVLGASSLAVIGWWAGLAWWRGPLAAALGCLVACTVVARAVRRFGGVTGDVFGASIELTLAALLVALA